MCSTPWTARTPPPIGKQASIALQQAQRSYDKTVDRQYVRAEVDGTLSVPSR